VRANRALRDAGFDVRGLLDAAGKPSGEEPRR
jgi:hypothetical protein